MIERYQDYRTRQPGKGPQFYQPTLRNSGVWDGSMRSDWNFDTIRSSAMGSIRSMAKDLTAHGMIPDEEYEDDEYSDYDVRESVNTDGATHGSEVTGNPLLPNNDAGHSTVIIRPVSAALSEKDIPALVTDNGSDETANLEPSTPPRMSPDTSEPPPAYTGSVRSTSSSQRRASYAARNNLTTGTVLGEADLGNGIDTIRPVKKVDTVRSLRLSEDYVGSIRRERSGSQSGSAPSSPVSPKSGSAKRAVAANAGRAMVDEVLLPTLERATRDDMDAREIESLSMISRGFEELREVNPELAYNVILDILSGINE